jgi:glycerophosphoryl diester phosphodiesterase
LINAPENSMEAFYHAIELGADSIEFDVRLTTDKIPIIFHYFYLDEITDASGPIFDFTLDQIRKVNIFSNRIQKKVNYKIPTLDDVLENIGGKIGLEIEIKGPEPESAQMIGKILNKYENLFDTIEVTSYEPTLLRLIQECCPGIITDLLLPISENWMKSDVIAYLAVKRASLANARAVHLHPTQLLPEIVSLIRKKDIQVHAWNMNDKESLRKVVNLEINRICTDDFMQAFNFRKKQFS